MNHLKTNWYGSHGYIAYIGSYSFTDLGVMQAMGSYPTAPCNVAMASMDEGNAK